MLKSYALYIGLIDTWESKKSIWGTTHVHYIKKKFLSSRSRRHILKIANYYLIYLGKYWRVSTLEEMKNIFGADF